MKHPFIVKLFAAFDTPSKLFYATEFLQGGELFTWLEKFGVFDRVRFFLKYPHCETLSIQYFFILGNDSILLSRNILSN